ncbi:unnamed protein product [marine sediment metagenome]|uniref:Uncharacterized protein n=1 Tax=marine sediment metagenome TaxID=412755 RepID=X0SBG2_9ZZZZ
MGSRLDLFLQQNNEKRAQHRKNCEKYGTTVVREFLSSGASYPDDQFRIVAKAWLKEKEERAIAKRHKITTRISIFAIIVALFIGICASGVSLYVSLKNQKLSESQEQEVHTIE